MTDLLEAIRIVERILLRLSDGEPVATSSEMTLIAMRYVEGLTLGEAAKRLGVSRDRVRQKEDEAFKRIIQRIRSIRQP